MEKLKITRNVAHEIIEKFENSASVESASYDVCEFILAAARLAASDIEFARQIAAETRDLIMQGRATSLPVGSGDRSLCLDTTLVVLEQGQVPERPPTVPRSGPRIRLPKSDER